MNPKLKKFFIKYFLLIFVIHLAYFIYGFFQFEGIQNIDTYSKYYRFKFYDDVSISHFFVSSLLILFFSFILLKNYTIQYYLFEALAKIGVLFFLFSISIFTFFISYNTGKFIKLHVELTYSDFNKDKKLLNELNPFLYRYTTYSSQKLFNYENILYPKPYPVTEEIDSSLVTPEALNAIQTRYFSIDTLKLSRKKHKNLDKLTDSIFNEIGIEKNELKKRILSQEVVNDSIKIIYKGIQIYPEYDENVCVFLKNKTLFKPISNKPIFEQQMQAAQERYKLLYNYSRDSLQNRFKLLEILFKKINIKSEIKSKDLTIDAFYYKENDEPLNNIRNVYDRDKLIEKINALERLYNFTFIHKSIKIYFYSTVLIFWFLLSLMFYFTIRSKSFHKLDKV